MKNSTKLTEMWVVSASSGLVKIRCRVGSDREFTSEWTPTLAKKIANEILAAIERVEAGRYDLTAVIPDFRR